MRPDELRDMDLETLNAKETELRRKLFEAKFKAGAANTKADFFTKADFYKKAKKDIARIKTIITEKLAQKAKEDLIKG